MEKNTKEEFFKILNFYKQASYPQKIAFMKKTWGNVATETTINYQDNCSITIGFDDSGKYFFDFNCSEIDFAEMSERLPEYAEAILNLDEEKLKEAYPEFVELQAIDKNNKELQANDSNSIEDEKAFDENIKLSSDYINIYNGIRINRKK